MNASLLIPSYIIWHYSAALGDIWGIFTNLAWFIYHFFSVPTLAKTIFSPWHKLGERYGRGFDPSAFLSTFVINTLLRIVGFIIRLAVLLLALAVFAVLIFAGILFYILWLAMPIVLFVLFASAVYYLTL